MVADALGDPIVYQRNPPITTMQAFKSQSLQRGIPIVPAHTQP